MKLSNEEKMIVGVVRHNRLFPPKEVNRKWRVGRFDITYSKRSSSNLWGRFGGGWQWNLGVQASEGFGTVIVNLVVCSFIITRHKEAKV